MKTLTVSLLALASILVFFASNSVAADLSQFDGKWSVNKTNDEGRTYTQTIELKNNKFKFSIVTTDGTVVLYAEGEVKLEKAGDFSAMKFFNIRAGRSSSELDPVDDERTVIYKLSYDTWTVASNFDKDRNQPPVLDVYKKAGK